MVSTRASAATPTNTSAVTSRIFTIASLVAEAGSTWVSPSSRTGRTCSRAARTTFPGSNHGLVNEYVLVEVSGNSWTATMHAFEPGGNYLGVLDSFQSDVADPTAMA